MTTFDAIDDDSDDQYYRLQSPALTDERPNSLSRSQRIKQRYGLTSGRSTRETVLGRTEASTVRKTTTNFTPIVPPIAGITYDDTTCKPHFIQSDANLRSLQPQSKNVTNRTFGISVADLDSPQESIDSDPRIKVRDCHRKNFKFTSPRTQVNQEFLQELLRPLKQVDSLETVRL